MLAEEENDDKMALETERMLIESSLLPTESLEFERAQGKGATMVVKSATTSSQIILQVRSGYPSLESVTFDVESSGSGMQQSVAGSDVALERAREGWAEAVETGNPIYYTLTTYLLPLIAPQPDVAPPEVIPTHKSKTELAHEPSDNGLHHVLFTSHHLIAPSKRKDLKSLSSSLNLKGFGKVGHPGIIFAEGSKEDLEDFVQEVKSWQWLALRLRVFERDPEGVARAQGRGEWLELEKLSDAVEWLKGIGKGHLLLDIGMGSGSEERGS